MSNNRKNEAKTDIDLFNFLSDNKKYYKSWETKRTSNKYIQSILDKSSKSGSGYRGEPDLIYVNENKKLLILVENKHLISNHSSREGNKPKDYAVDGIKHYLSFFLFDRHKKNSETTVKYIHDWSIVGIAFSGDINDEYNHLISTFIISDNEIKDIETNEIIDEDDYLAFFENIDLENISKNISKSSSKIVSVFFTPY